MLKLLRASVPRSYFLRSGTFFAAHSSNQRKFHACLSASLTSNYRTVLEPTLGFNQNNLLRKNTLFETHKKTTLFEAISGNVRLFSTKDESLGDDGSSESDKFDNQLPATVAVPEVWPHLPVIAISRHIVFPRFIKLIEVFSL